MKRWMRIVLIVVGVLLLAALVGPFLVPVPPLEGTVLPQQLADPDSRFLEINDIDIHYKLMGEGEPALVLLHGFAASTFSWREVMAPLAKQHTVVTFDRPAFGLTERPLPGEWKGQSPYSPEAQVWQTVGLMDGLGIERAILVGNSAGGGIATLTALEHPHRVQALVLVDPAIYTHARSLGLLRPLLRTPQMRRLGPLIVRRIQSWGIDFARSAWHDPDRITPQVWEGYLKPLQAQDWDRALWEFTVVGSTTDLPDRLEELTLPVLVITGDDDRIVPAEQSVRLAGELPDAELVVIPDCGHVPHEECPQLFLEAVSDFLAGLE
jgi:pimeloyl-ACP methyl ester carboxylesterase